GQGQDTEEIEQAPHDPHVISQFSNLNIIIGGRCASFISSAQQRKNGDSTLLVPRIIDDMNNIFAGSKVCPEPTNAAAKGWQPATRPWSSV
ncbi:hypothetical protein, partial [Aeromonas hydrophila]|uniref:hypothetical protein n=1 Tax=Aeromonas hydrophila TaxID=644 RepID=UPI0013773FCB